MKEILGFAGRLLLLLSGALLLHLLLLHLAEKPLFDNLLLAAYVVNFLLAVMIPPVFKHKVGKASQ